MIISTTIQLIQEKFYVLYRRICLVRLGLGLSVQPYPCSNKNLHNPIVQEDLKYFKKCRLEEMWFKTVFIIKFLLKAGIYLCLIALVYFYDIIEVLNKYEENLTNIANSEMILDNGIKPPFMTLCIGPRAKQEVLDKYDMSKNALNEPNSTQKNIFVGLNKTLEDFFMEATFKLNIDFRLYMIWWEYDSEGWKDHKLKLSVKDNNSQKVRKQNDSLFF